MNMKLPLNGSKWGAARLDRTQLLQTPGLRLVSEIEGASGKVAAMSGIHLPLEHPAIADFVRKSRLRKIRYERDAARRLELKLY